jgi:predicted helicase
MIDLNKHQLKACKIISEATKGIFQYPTGTGKTLIQSSSIVEDIMLNKVGVYVVLSPRILLANQLFHEIREMLKDRHVDAQYLLVHSGRVEDEDDLDEDADVASVLKHLPYREIGKTTKSAEVKKEYERAIREGVPLIICGTYHSAKKIKDSGIPLRIVHCDEAHNTVAEDKTEVKGFGWVPNGFDKQAEKIFFFTATLKVSSVEDGVGMNNKAHYGEILDSMTPKEAVNLGLIVGPRMHVVTTVAVTNDNEDAADIKAVTESFKQHHAMLNGQGAKLLVVCKGSRHLGAMMEASRFFKDLRLVRPRLKVFDISSKHGPRINGVLVDREEFLSTLQGLDDVDEALIFHIDILSEGIDVPGITGVMPLNNMKLSKFLQTLGRATRLHKTDRERLKSGEIKPCEAEKHIKPYAWLIVPYYGEQKEELHGNFEEQVKALREYGFKAEEHIFIKQSKGAGIPKIIEHMNEVERKKISVLVFAEEICHDLEEEEEYLRIYEVIADVTLNDQVKELLEF